MGKTAFSALVVWFRAFCWAAPPTGEYSVDVNVSSSYWEMDTANLGPQAVQRLKAVIGGKKDELEAPTKRGSLQAGVTLLNPGDYKARLVQDVHKTGYESSQAYAFLFPDKKTRKFAVVGLSE
jgi:hypothetical protein